MAPLSWLVMAAHVPAGGAGGGMVRYVVELVRALNRRADVHIHVLASRSAAPWWRDDMGIGHVHPVPAGPVALAGVRDLTGVGVPTRRRVDVIHGTKHMLPVPRRSRLRVLTVHDMLPLDRPGDFGLSKRHLLRHPYLASLRRADLLLCVSDATRRRLASYLPEVANRSQVVRLGPADALLAAQPEPVRRLAGSRFVVAVGDNSPRKNLRTLLLGWSRLRSRFPDIRLALVGPRGWGVEGPSVQMRDLDGVVALGHLPDGQLRWCYENAEAVAMPSMLEGFGLPAAEALAFDTPLIISEDDALAEAAQGHALVADSADPKSWAKALSQTLTMSSGHRPDAGSQAAARDWDSVAEETVAAVRALLPATQG